MGGHKAFLREFVWGSVELQLLATVVVIGTLILAIQVVRRLRPLLGQRYTTNFAEAVEMLALAIGMLFAAFLLADIWALSFLFDRMVDDALIDRWIFVRISISGALLASGYLLARVLNRILDSFWKEKLITRHQREVGYHLLDGAIIAVALLLVLSVWLDDPTDVAVGAGVLTAVLGLAARQTVAAVIAGFALLVTRPFRAGDWIEIIDEDGVTASGIVQDVTILYTRLRTFNDEHLQIPNHQVTDHRLTNYTRTDRLRIDIEVGVDYETDLEHAQAVLQEVGAGLDLASDTNEPRAVLKQFDDSSIVLELQFWIKNPTRRRVWEAQSTAIRAIKDTFDLEGITIPFPQRAYSSRTRADGQEGLSSTREQASRTGSQAEE